MKLSFYILHRLGVWVREMARRGLRRAVLLAMGIAFIVASLHEIAYRTVLARIPDWVNSVSTILMSMMAAGATVWLALLAYRHMARQQDDETAARELVSRELAEERNLLRALMEGTEDLIYFKDRESRFLRINETMARRFGLAGTAEAVGKTDQDLFPSELARQKLADERDVLAGGKPLVGREELDRVINGRQSWVSTSKMPLRDRHGAIIGTFGISRDITERKLAEQRRAAISVGLQRILEITDELIACEDEETLFRRAVELARSKLGLERCSIIIDAGGEIRGTFGTNLRGETTDERSHRFPRAGLWEERMRLRGVTESRWSVSDETFHEWDGSGMRDAGRGPVAVTPVQSSRHHVIGVFCNDNALSGTPLDPARQEVVAVYCSLLGNIVARKRAEREQLNVVEQQRATLEQADRLTAVGTLAAGMAHEINNPLQGMLSHLRALQPYVPQDSAGSRNLEMVQKGIDSIASLVRRLLMLGTAAESGHEGTDVREAMDFVTQLLESQFRRTAVRIERGEIAGTPRIGMPRAEFVQIVMNLLLNARDAMPDGGVIRIETGHGGGVARVVVSDTGPGIPPELRNRIFAPFFTTKGSKGTGLGLSVTESLVRSNGGTIAVESPAGGGARFVITLPVFQGGRG